MQPEVNRQDLSIVNGVFFLFFYKAPLANRNERARRGQATRRGRWIHCYVLAITSVYRTHIRCILIKQLILATDQENFR